MNSMKINDHLNKIIVKLGLCYDIESNMLKLKYLSTTKYQLLTDLNP